MSGKNTFSKEFSNFSRYGIAGLALLASGCTTVSKGNIVHDRFGDDCFSEFN